MSIYKHILCIHAGLTSKAANWRFLSTPAKKARRRQITQAMKVKQRRIVILEAKIKEAANANTTLIHNTDIHDDTLVDIIQANDHVFQKEATDSAKRIFWNQQVYYMHVNSMH
jgi:hypothetical protein